MSSYVKIFIKIQFKLFYISIICSLSVNIILLLMLMFQVYVLFTPINKQIYLYKIGKSIINDFVKQ